MPLSLLLHSLLHPFDFFLSSPFLPVRIQCTSITTPVNPKTCFNPLGGRDSYSATSNDEVGTLAVDWWAVTFGSAWRGPVGAAARPGPSSL